MNKTNPSPVFRFLDLPPEIRLMVYDLIFYDFELHIVRPPRQWLHDTASKIVEKPAPCGITMVSKNCRAEVFSTLAKNRTFVFHCPLSSSEYQIPAIYLTQTRKACVSHKKLGIQAMEQMPCLEELTVHWPVYHHGRSQRQCVRVPLPDFKVYYSAHLHATESEIVTGFLHYSGPSSPWTVRHVLQRYTSWLQSATARQKPRPARMMLLVDVLLVDPRGIQLSCVWRDVCIDVETCQIVRSGPKVFCTLDKHTLAKDIGGYLSNGLEVKLSTVATRYIDLVRARLGAV